MFKKIAPLISIEDNYESIELSNSSFKTSNGAEFLSFKVKTFNIFDSQCENSSFNELYLKSDYFSINPETFLKQQVIPFKLSYDETFYNAIGIIENLVNNALVKKGENSSLPLALQTIYDNGSRQLIKPIKNNNSIIYLRPKYNMIFSNLEDERLHLCDIDSNCKDGFDNQFCLEICANKILVCPHGDYPASIYFRITRLVWRKMEKFDYPDTERFQDSETIMFLESSQHCLAQTQPRCPAGIFTDQFDGLCPNNPLIKSTSNKRLANEKTKTNSKKIKKSV